MKSRLTSLVRGLKKVPLTIYAILVLGILPALAAGVYTNGFPTVFPAGTTGNQSINGQSIGRGYTTLPLTGSELIPADTQLANGQVPQTEAISVSQLKLFTTAPITQAPAVSGATVTVDTSLAELYTLTLTANNLLGTPSNLVAGKTWRMLVNQDSTGSRTLAFATALYTWPCSGYASSTAMNTSATCSGNSAPVLSATASSVDLLQFTYDGIKIRGQYLLNFK